MSPITTVVIAAKGTLSSSATICLYAVCAVDWPKSTLPVRIRMVLSARISNHDVESAASSEFLATAAFAGRSHILQPTKVKPTTSAPPVLTNCRRESVAPWKLVMMSMATWPS